MSDPFKIDGPTCIPFSGGRSSGYGLHLALRANGGLPADARVLFCNTGKETEATLRFVKEVGDRWGVPITWLEYQFNEGDAEAGWRVVDFDTADRSGGPFQNIIRVRDGVLPNIRSAYCSSELKTRTMKRYLQQAVGWTEWDTLLGIRADEPVRVSNFRANPSPEGKHEEIRLPMADAGIGKFDVKAFWDAHEFDLGLANNAGVTPEGNCDLCFKKSDRKVLSLIRQQPSKAIWWIRREEEAATHAAGDGRYFALDRPTYGQMYRYAQDQREIEVIDLEEEDREPAGACFCGD